MLKLLRYLLGFSVLGVVAIFLISRVVDYGAEVKVPSVVGKDILNAKRVLAEKGLSLKVIGEDYDEDVPTGYVLKQDVPAGRKVKKGVSIGVILNKEPELVLIPSVEGETLDRAREIAQEHGLRIGKITRVHSDTVQKGRVIAQRPLPGDMSSAGEINLLVSKGPYEVLYKCPYFVGKTIEEARQIADALGLKLKEKGEGERIIAQKPKQGSIIKKGDVVEVTLGVGWGWDVWF